MTTRKIKIEYSGSIFWLIFWFIAFFPVALVLYATGGSFRGNDGTMHSITYHGSRFWLCFWTLIFFPVAIALALLNGFEVVSSAPS